ncbi:MAG: bifunctional tRNA (5-methylaminomethyl-2-thiouridine)(34)-methyltransferase MnmD/FAD-dependent 5-carboxymethylaminomethyl-2-thiouridine(34) oxidoreductase MnmC [Candidatus Competibacterales bacterium]|nr:bifunctional tRNA (5-methylaminomethyl-2-thiouridine)(34)-methyltransferase MnmD/FAD-dependent 5-carboxymethylaminomethyl-2-thiouridine(34) oxidoreductase MnmC [Candidatus Competibacterales bacterium]
MTDPDLRLSPGEPPYSGRYGDHYYSRAGGLAEARQVFLAGNGLPDRWRGRERFVIGETGFGTGLNCLATWQAWRDDPRRCRRLHYLAVEKHPLCADSLHQALAPWPELAGPARELVAAWPPPVPGVHRLTLAAGALVLDLWFGEAEAMLAEISAAVDAWYLDGFAPSRNPAMWSPPLLARVARCTAAGGTVASYTVAGAVRRGLAAAGFRVDKRPGFAGKRERLTGILERSPETTTERPWLDRPAATGGDTALVIGAGLAGCCIARALAERGWTVAVLERRPVPAGEASGNPAGVVMPRPEAQVSPAGRFYLQAYLQALRLYADRGEAAGWHGCGVLQPLPEPAQAARSRRFIETYALPPAVARWLPAPAASEYAGLALDCEAVVYPGGGWLAPAELCQVLLDHPGIWVRCGVDAVTIERIDEGWRVHGAGGESDVAPVLVLANAYQACRLIDGLPLRPARGQLSGAPATPESRGQGPVLYGKGYLVPPDAGGRHRLGASFATGDAGADLRPADDGQNLARLARLLPALAAGLAPGLRGEFAAVRATTPDRLPLVGAVPDREAFRRDYASLARDARRGAGLPPACHLPGLYLLTGLGARGITAAPLAAELLAALIAGEPLPLGRPSADALNPARFIVRELKRRQREPVAG